MQMSSDPVSKNVPEPFYSQLVSSIISPYDATLVFYQTHPVRAGKEGLNDFKIETHEVARIVLPHRALRELSDLLAKQAGEMTAKGSEDETIAKLKRGEKRSK